MKRKITTIIVILSVLSNFVAPIMARPAQGSVVSTVSSFTGCYAAGKLTGAATKALDDNIKLLQQKITDLAAGPLKTFLTKLFGISLPGGGGGLTTVPVSDSAVQNSLSNYVTTYVNKNYRDNIIARCLTREILNTLIANSETIIKTKGRDGGSAAVKNWTNFITQAQYRGENIFRAELSTAQLCPYLSDDIKTAFGIDPKKKTPLTGQNTRTDSAQPFSLSAKCTMPAGFTPEKYQQDFAGNGGWDAYARMLEPQNNAWGISALANDEMAKQRTLQQLADTNQVLANNGLTGISGNGKNDSCSIKGPTGDCLVYKDIKTTGNYLASGLGAGLNAQYAWLTTGDAIGNIISDLASSLTQSLLNKFMNFDNPDEGGVGPVSLPTDTPAPTDTSSLSCAEQGLSETYTFNVSSAISSFISSNPTVASLPDDDEGGPNNTSFMNGVVNTLTSAGLTAGRILHVATGVPSGDKIIVGHNPPDADGEVYDIINSTGDGQAFSASGKTSADCKTHADWSKLIPAGSGGSSVCIVLATKTSLTPISNIIKYGISHIDLRTGESEIKRLLDPSIIAIHNLNRGLPTSESDTSTKIQNIETDLGSFESLAITNNKTAPEANQLNDLRIKIAKGLDDLLGETVCGTSTPPPTPPGGPTPPTPTPTEQPPQ